MKMFAFASALIALTATVAVAPVQAEEVAATGTTPAIDKAIEGAVDAHATGVAAEVKTDVKTDAKAGVTSETAPAVEAAGATEASGEVKKDAAAMTTEEGHAGH